MARFMAGRNGTDQFNIFLLAVDVILLLVAGLFARKAGVVLYPLVALGLGFVYYRMLSRNLLRRREENERFIRWWLKLSGNLRARRERWIQRKDYKFFTCPACKTILRVPRGHGKIKIVCRKCGKSFTGKS